MQQVFSVSHFIQFCTRMLTVATIAYVLFISHGLDINPTVRTSSPEFQPYPQLFISAYRHRPHRPHSLWMKQNLSRAASGLV